MSESMKFSVRANAPLERVHRALTTASELREWLAEHAEVDLPHTYAFWGRHTPQGDVPRQRPLHVDERTVRFGWHLDGEDTTVEIGLTPQDGATIIEVEQSHFPGWQVAVEEGGFLGATHTFWALAMVNLVDHVEGRPLTPKADFTAAAQEASMVIDASPEAVYDAIVDPAKFASWFGMNVELDAHVGGRWAMGGFEHEPHPAKILDLDPGRRFAVEFDDGTVTAWELEGSGGATRLTFVQSGFDQGKPPWGAWMGWLSGLAELRRYLELDETWRSVWVSLDVAE